MMTMIVRKRDPLPVMVAATLVVTGAMLSCTALEFTVGGKKGWSPNVNYTVWASDQHFHVQDWLLFKFDKTQYNVLEVNETNYENCNDNDFITNITRGGGKDVFQLTQARPYYFLSKGGYCYQGMKLAINVETLPPPSPPAAPPASDGGVEVVAVWFLLSMNTFSILCFWVWL